MSAVKITKDYFSGDSKLHGRNSTSLAAILRGLAIDNARLAVAVTTVADFTDSSTGIAGAGIVDVVIPTAAVDATATNVGTPRTALNTALGKLDDAFACVAENVNLARARLGLAALTYMGTVAESGTIPACDKALAATSGTNTATLGTVRASLKNAKDNVNKLTFAVNEVLTAIGAATVASALEGNRSFGAGLVACGNTTASATGADAASDSDVDAALLAIVNNISTLASKYNAAMSQTSQATTPLNVVAG